MKKLATVLFLLLLPRSFAADPNVVIDSAQPLVGAVEGLNVLDTVFVVPSYLPGYGLQLSAFGTQSEATAVFDLASTMRDILEGLAPTVQGLEPGDWISIGLVYDPVVPVNIVVRLKSGGANAAEIWVEGNKITK